jgi:hypothetical protein
MNNNMRMFDNSNNCGCCLACAMRFSPGWVRENYPDYYYKHSYYNMEMPKEIPPDILKQMNSMNMMNPMNSMNMMNPMNSMDMMEQMQSMNTIWNQMIQNQKSSQNSNNDSINVLFCKMDGQKKPPYIIQCSLSDQVSDIIQKYKNLSSDNDTNNTFIFNGKELNLKVTADEAGLFNQAFIFVMTTTNTTK